MDGHHVAQLHPVELQSMGGWEDRAGTPRMLADVDMGQPGEGYEIGLG